MKRRVLRHLKGRQVRRLRKHAEGLLAANPPLAPEFCRRGGLLRLDPMFEPLRKNPRFQKLLASSAEK